MQLPVRQAGVPQPRQIRRICGVVCAGFLVLAAGQPAGSTTQLAAVVPPQAQIPEPEPEIQCAAAPAFTQEGVASFYGHPHHGRATANGEKFDMHALTAAHRRLPLGTLIRVTNLANGQSIELRVNDRGPYVKRRVLDVSRYAAQQLGFDSKGITRVRIETAASCPGPEDKIAEIPSTKRTATAAAAR